MLKHTEKDILSMELIHEPSGMKMIPIRAYKKDIGKESVNMRWFVDIRFEDGVIVEDRSLSSFLQRKTVHPEYYKGRKRVEKLVLGREVVANNGMKATITKYLGRNKVEITFEDGTISPTTNITCFNKGQIRYDLGNIRVGEKSKDSNGEVIEIVEYRGSNDIDIKFKDGKVMTTTYWNFKHQKVTKAPKITRVGETSITPDGRKMTIINYRNSHDVDVQLEDGTILKNRYYGDFKKSLISGRRKIKVYTGDQYYQSKLDMIATIKDNTRGKLTVELEDGTIKDKVDNRSLVKGTLQHPKFIECRIDHKENGIKYYNCRCRNCKENHIISIDNMKDFVCNAIVKTKKKRDLRLERQGEVLELPNGKQATILEYRSSTDVDVEYEGEVYKHKTYSSIKRGVIKSYTEQRTSRLGEKYKNKNGDTMAIIAYRSASDIDIKFEDGTIVEHKRYSNFIRGNIAKEQSDRCGEITKNNEGYSMKIIEYLGNNNITVQFEDGTIVKHKQYSNFKKGAILKNSRRDANTFKQNNLYKKIKTKFGLKVWFIDYMDQHNATIEFEDGTIVNVSNTKNVEHGHVSHPKYLKVKLHHTDGNKVYYSCQCKICHTKHILELNKMKDYECNNKQEKINRNDLIYNERIGETRKVYDDITLKIIEYRGCEDLDLRFTDGTVLSHQKYRRFKDNKIKHPKYKDIIRAYSYRGEKYFLCTCRKCKGKHVLKLSEMKDFECKEE